MKKYVKAAKDYVVEVDDIDDVFDELSDADVFDMWNNYAKDYDKPEMHEMSKIEDILLPKIALREILSSLDKNFDPDDEYFTVDDMGYIVSFSDWYETASPFDREALINAIAETGDDFGSTAVRDLMQGE